jgi:hypothetical protein
VAELKKNANVRTYEHSNGTEKKVQRQTHLFNYLFNLYLYTIHREVYIFKLPINVLSQSKHTNINFIWIKKFEFTYEIIILPVDTCSHSLYFTSTADMYFGLKMTLSFFMFKNTFIEYSYSIKLLNTIGLIVIFL